MPDALGLLLDIGKPGAADGQVGGHLHQGGAQSRGDARRGATAGRGLGGAQPLQQLAHAPLDDRA